MRVVFFFLKKNHLFHDLVLNYQNVIRNPEFEKCRLIRGSVGGVGGVLAWVAC